MRAFNIATQSRLARTSIVTIAGVGSEELASHELRRAQQPLPED
jgi:hypothetical protein